MHVEEFKTKEMLDKAIADNEAEIMRNEKIIKDLTGASKIKVRELKKRRATLLLRRSDPDDMAIFKHAATGQI